MISFGFEPFVILALVRLDSVMKGQVKLLFLATRCILVWYRMRGRYTWFPLHSTETEWWRSCSQWLQVVRPFGGRRRGWAGQCYGQAGLLRILPTPLVMATTVAVINMAVLVLLKNINYAY